MSEKKTSFTLQIKKELAGQSTAEACCLQSECAGMLLFARRFEAEGMEFCSESEAAAQRLLSLLRRCFGIKTEEKTVNAGRHVLHTVGLQGGESQSVYTALGYEPGQVSLRVLMSLFQCERCAASFLRGAFLACGAAAEPEKGSRVEFVTRRSGLARDLMYLLESETGMAARLSTRAGKQVVYIKNGQQAEELLALMGAGVSSMELMGGKILRGVRNEANRIYNCDSANTKKVVGAATRHREAILSIKKTKGLAWLTPELRELAVLRLENPELSLTQLGQLTDPPMTKSGVAHRLARLVEIADSVKGL